MRLLAFVKDVYAPGLHLAYSAAWFLALEGTLVSLEGRGAAWVLDLRVLAAVLTVFLVLFFLRIVDEWKDLAYDRVHNPDRPLVRGAVTRRDLALYLALTAACVVGLNAFTSWKLAAIACADMAWGVALVFVEKVSRRVRDGMLLNLAVTYPVNVALSVYTYVFFLDRYGAVPTARGALVVVAFALAFLNYEISRKTIWPSVATAGERLYSKVLGGHGAIALAFGCALSASAILGVLLLGQATAWSVAVVVVPLVPASVALVRFLRLKGERFKLTALGTQFLLAFYVGLTARAFAANLVSVAGN